LERPGWPALTCARSTAAAYLTTAKVLRLAVLPSLLARAEEVIE
jgi:hypothetical protein